MNTVIGIDPGKSGGIAVIAANDGEPAVDLYRWPETELDLWLLLAQLEPASAWIEKVHAGPDMGSSAAFKFGRTNGLVHMAALAAGLRIEFVSPQKWQRYFGLLMRGRGLGQRDTDKKNRNKAKAQELFPFLKITHAVADALLIAEFGRQHDLLFSPKRPGKPANLPF